MKAPRPLIAYDIETGNATRHASIIKAEKACGFSKDYLAKKINTGKPAKGFLFYDAAKAYTPETIAKVRKLSPAFDEAFKSSKRHPDHEISVRIDPRTVILVKASKWTPDYAERYKARMEASRPGRRHHDTFVEMNDRINERKKAAKAAKRGPGRPRKEKA